MVSIFTYNTIVFNEKYMNVSYIEKNDLPELWLRESIFTLPLIQIAKLWYFSFNLLPSKMNSCKDFSIL